MAQNTHGDCPETGEVLAAGVTSMAKHDGQLLPQLLEHVEIEKVMADGAYDHLNNWQLLHEKKIQAHIRPKRGASLSSERKARWEPNQTQEALLSAKVFEHNPSLYQPSN